MARMKRMSPAEVDELEEERIACSFDPCPGPRKQDLIAEMRQAREFLAGAIAFLREGDEDIMETSLDMAEEALVNVDFWLGRRRELKGERTRA